MTYHLMNRQMKKNYYKISFAILIQIYSHFYKINTISFLRVYPNLNLQMYLMPGPRPVANATLVPQMSGQASIYSNAHMQLFSYFRPGNKKNSIHYMGRNLRVLNCPFSVIYYLLFNPNEKIREEMFIRK